jgi:hypothetical protein
MILWLNAINTLLCICMHYMAINKAVKNCVASLDSKHCLLQSSNNANRNHECPQPVMADS